MRNKFLLVIAMFISKYYVQIDRGRTERKNFWLKVMMHGPRTRPFDKTFVFFINFFAGRGKLTFGKQNYIGNFYDDKMIGPGTYIFPNGTQQHGEYIVVEEEIEEVNETGKGKNDNDTENRSRTKQVKIKWISKSGDTPPVTVVKKETLIN